MPRQGHPPYNPEFVNTMLGRAREGSVPDLRALHTVVNDPNNPEYGPFFASAETLGVTEEMQELAAQYAASSGSGA